MKHVFSILFLGLLFSCQKEESSGFPDVRTIPEVIISENGVIVQIEISSHNNEIIDYGVVYSEKENIDASENEFFRVSLGKFTDKNKVSVSIDRYLAKDQSYVVKAYAITPNYTIYGNPVIFVTTNSKGLILRDFYPKKAFIGDTITIWGEYFSPRKADNLVWFDEAQIIPFSSSDTLLKVIVPVMNSSAELNLKVATTVGIAEFKDHLSIGIPIIYDVTPRIVLPLENVKITGKGLHLIGEIFINYAYVNNQIISKTDTSLVFEVGRNPEGNFFIDYSLNNYYQIYSTNEKIQIIHPKILSVSPTLAWIDTILTVRGSHLDKLDDFYLSHILLEEVSKTESLVKLKIPTVFFASNVIGVFCNFTEIASTDVIHFNTPVVTEVSKTSVTYGDKITIKGDRFFYGLSSNFGEFQYINKNEATILLNEFYSPGMHSLSLYYNVEYPLFDITILSIEITELVPYEIQKGSEITIKGLYFPLEFPHNSVTVYLDNAVMIIKETNKDYIKFIVPNREVNYSEYPKLTLIIGNQQIIRERAFHMTK